MRRLACIHAAAGALALVAAGCSVPEEGTGAHTAAPATRPATGRAKEEPVTLREVEVTILGKSSDVKGLAWPDDPGERWQSRSVEEPCDLTVHLPGGKVLKMRTRPILIVSRVMPTDVIGTVDAPPEGERGSLREKAEEVERLLSQWQITPDARIRADLDEWKRRDYGGTGIGGQLRVAIKPDARTRIGFRVNSGGPRLGGWHLVVEFEAEPEEMQRARVKYDVRTG